MIDLKYDLVIEATVDPNFLGFYSLDLEGFAEVGHAIEDCLYKARWGMEEHVELLREQEMPVPDMNAAPTIIIRNEPRRLWYSPQDQVGYSSHSGFVRLEKAP